MAVQPELLGLLLTEILQAIGDNPVVNASDRPLPLATDPYVAALVSEPLPDESLAEVEITLPPPGEVVGEVRHGTERRPLTITGTQDVLDALERYWPPEHDAGETVPTS